MGGEEAAVFRHLRLKGGKKRILSEKTEGKNLAGIRVFRHEKGRPIFKNISAFLRLLATCPKRGGRVIFLLTKGGGIGTNFFLIPVV